MSECWIKLFSVAPWTAPQIWRDFFRIAEEIFAAKLTHLDADDPPKRKVTKTNFDQSGDFVTGFGAQEDARWLFARFSAAKVELTIHHHKAPRIGDRDFPNSLTIYFPEGYLDTEGRAASIERLFSEANRLFRPFYSFADLRSVVVTKKKSSGAVNLQQELLGVFWLTYFNREYVRFFGAEALANTGYSVPVLDGVILKLGSVPTLINPELRQRIELQLGPDSFVNPAVDRPKPIGRHALTFVRLSEQVRQTESGR